MAVAPDSERMSLIILPSSLSEVMSQLPSITPADRSSRLRRPGRRGPGERPLRWSPPSPREGSLGSRCRCTSCRPASSAWERPSGRGALHLSAIRSERADVASRCILEGRRETVVVHSAARAIGKSEVLAGHLDRELILLARRVGHVRPNAGTGVTTASIFCSGLMWQCTHWMLDSDKPPVPTIPPPRGHPVGRARTTNRDRPSASGEPVSTTAAMSATSIDSEPTWVPQLGLGAQAASFSPESQRLTMV